MGPPRNSLKAAKASGLTFSAVGHWLFWTVLSRQFPVVSVQQS